MKHTIETLANNGPFDSQTEYVFSDGTRFVEILKPTEDGGYRTRVLRSDFPGDVEHRSTRHELQDYCKASKRVTSFDAVTAASDLPDAEGATVTHKDGTVYTIVRALPNGTHYMVADADGRVWRKRKNVFVAE